MSELNSAPSNVNPQSLTALKTPVVEKYFSSAVLKPLKGQAQLPYSEITKEQALSGSHAYYVGRFVCGLIIEAEKFIGKESQFLITYEYKNSLKPTDSKIIPTSGSLNGLKAPAILLLNETEMPSLAWSLGRYKAPDHLNAAYDRLLQNLNDAGQSAVITNHEEIELVRLVIQDALTLAKSSDRFSPVTLQNIMNKIPPAEVIS